MDFSFFIQKLLLNCYYCKVDTTTKEIEMRIIIIIGSFVIPLMIGCGVSKAKYDLLEVYSNDQERQKVQCWEDVTRQTNLMNGINRVNQMHYDELRKMYSERDEHQNELIEKYKTRLGILSSQVDSLTEVADSLYEVTRWDSVGVRVVVDTIVVTDTVYKSSNFTVSTNYKGVSISDVKLIDGMCPNITMKVVNNTKKVVKAISPEITCHDAFGNVIGRETPHTTPIYTTLQPNHYVDITYSYQDACAADSEDMDAIRNDAYQCQVTIHNVVFQ